MPPTVGRIVHYTLTEADAEAANRRRGNGSAGSDGGGMVVHVGNHAAVGQVCAALVVRTFDGPYANLQVFLDGNDTLWATSRSEGDGPGFWQWPARV